MKQRKRVLLTLKIFLSLLILNNTSVWGQTGINTSTPHSTLDVTAIKNASHIAGIIAPRLTLTQLADKGNTLYKAEQRGTIIYITDISGNGNTGQRANIKSVGYYYFDGTEWIGFGVFSAAQASGSIKESFKTADHNGWYLLDGRAVSSLPANIRAIAVSLGFSSNLPNAKDKVLKSKTGSEVLGSTGGSNTLTITKDNLPNVSLAGTFTGTVASGGAHTHSLSATSSSTAHAHSLSATSSNTAHTHGLSLTSANSTHTHSFSATSTTNGAHTHTYVMPTRVNSSFIGSYSALYNLKAQVAKATFSAGAHTHTFSGTSASGGAAHNHTVTGTAASGGAAHNHTVTGTVASDGAEHTHTFSGTSDSGGAPHAHTISGTALVDTGGANTALDNRAAYMAVNTFIYLGQ